MVRTVLSSEKLFIGGDLNGHVGTTRAGFEGIHGGFGYGSRNQEGEEVLEFAVTFDLMIANNFFRKRQSHLVTFSSGNTVVRLTLSSQEERIDEQCLNCKVIRGECVVSQHKLVVADFRLQMHARRDKQTKIARIKWWKMKEKMSETFKKRVIKEGSWTEGDDTNNMWENMANCIRKVVSEVLGVTKGGRCVDKDTWWWNEEVQRNIKEKKKRYRRLFHDRSVDNIEKYKEAKKIAKRAVSVAKGRAYEDLYQRLGMKEGDKDIYKMAKVRERKTRDFNQVKCIKDEMENILIKEDDIKHRWQEYFNKLFNGDNENTTFHWDDSSDDTKKHFVRKIQESEVREALKTMKRGKAIGPDGIPIEVWRCLRDTAIIWLTKLFNHIFQSNKMSEEWRRSILVPIYKNKGDIQSCTNYREIKLMSHTMKLCERVIEHRLRGITRVSMNQFSFMPRRSTMEAIF